MWQQCTFRANTVGKSSDRVRTIGSHILTVFYSAGISFELSQVCVLYCDPHLHIHTWYALVLPVAVLD